MSGVIASRREAAKMERRDRILDAAAALVRDVGFDALSMVRIAERAQVSPATLYNLFKTRGEIFRQVFDKDLATFQAKVEQAPATDALDRIFVALDIARALYVADPDFYRAMARGGGSRSFNQAVTSPRMSFWRQQAEAARRARLLTPHCNVDLMGVALGQLMRGAFLDWAAGVVSTDGLFHEASHGFAMLLLSCATPEIAPSLRDRMTASRVEIERLAERASATG